MITALLCFTTELLLMNFRLDSQITEWTLKHQELDIKVDFPFLYQLVGQDPFQTFLVANNTCLYYPLLTQSTESTAFVAELWNIVI